MTAGRHQIEATVFGHGSPVVVIEPSFGGAAAEWRSVAEALAAKTTVVTYDRAPYGASSRATDRRRPADIAGDLHAVLEALGLAAPLVLVGFSAGGLYVRKYAAMYPADVAGMVLIESSHEGQTPLLNKVFSWKVRLEGALFYPRLMFSLPSWRGGADRVSMMREWRAFRGLSGADRPLQPGALGDRPLAVITRADGGPYGGRQWQVWHGFHEEQAQLSANSRHLLSGHPVHGLHESDPDLVIATIAEVIASVRTGTSLPQRLAGSGGG
ncbi:MAG TPA: alpha/beta hydrolase [Trebonia sp.]|nr:alpha/beta hydrolase [Trebonia sp.]